MHNGLLCCKEEAIGVATRIPLMEITCTYGTDVSSLAHANISEFGMHFQSFNAKDDMDAHLLHFLRPTDVRRLVETRQKFNDNSDLLTIFGCIDKRLDHL